MKVMAIFFSLVMFTFTSKAQSPKQFNYQGVMRDGGGALLTNQNVSLQISIVKDSVNGVAEYTEQHATATNQFGVFVISIGTGNVMSGNFSAIDWSTGNKFIHIEADPSGGSSYINMGTTQLLSVPFALYAQSAGSATNTPPLKAGDGISITNDTIHSAWKKTGNDIYSTNSGNVGIGVANPTQKLEVDGGIKVRDAATGSPGTIMYFGNNYYGYTNNGWTTLGKIWWNKLGSSITTNVRNTLFFSQDSIIIDKAGLYFFSFNVNGTNPVNYSAPFNVYDARSQAWVYRINNGTGNAISTAIPFFTMFQDGQYSTSILSYINSYSSNSGIYYLDAGDVLKISFYVESPGSPTPTTNYIINSYSMQILYLADGY